MFFSAQPVMPGVTRIRSIADTQMYLVEGEEQALLIDTGCGVGRLKDFVSTLTHKPVTVLLTHGHVDHALGARGFDDVYLNPLDREVYRLHSGREMQRMYPAALPPEELGGFDLPAGEEDWNEPLPFEAFRPLAVGDVFRLGGLSAVVTPGAGHTPGCVTVLLPELRVLILGDACNYFTFLFDAFASSVTDYRAMLSVLRAQTEGLYDRVLLLHRTGEGHRELISGVMEVCDDIMAGRTDDVPFQHFLSPRACIAKAVEIPSFLRADGKIGNVVYDPENLGK